MSDRVGFVCNGAPVDVDVAPGEIAADGAARASRPHVGEGRLRAPGAVRVLHGARRRRRPGRLRDSRARVDGRAVTTVEGLDARRAATGSPARSWRRGGSQCGFCTPGIVVRAAALLSKEPHEPADARSGLAAHLCRCTGWQTVYEAIELAADAGRTPRRGATLDAAARRADARRRHARSGSAPEVPLGGGGFADDTAPARRAGRGAAAARARASMRAVARRRARMGRRRLAARGARASAAKVQGRRTTIEDRPPLAAPERPPGGVRLATSWVEPAYLEPDASWCEPGGEPATPLANGGAFGGKADVACARSGARARRPVGPDRARRLLTRGRRAPWPEAAADRRDRGAATAT